MTRLCAIIIAHYKLDDPKCAMERVDIYRQSLTFIIVSLFDTEPPYGEDMQPGQGRPHPVPLPHVVRSGDKNFLAKHSSPLFLVTMSMTPLVNIA